MIALAMNRQAKISFINTKAFEFNYPVANNVAVAQQQLAAELAAVAAAAFTGRQEDRHD